MVKASDRYGRVCTSDPPNSAISISFYDLWHAFRRLMGGKSMGRLLVMGPQGNVVVDHVDELSDLLSQSTFAGNGEVRGSRACHGLRGAADHLLSCKLSSKVGQHVA